MNDNILTHKQQAFIQEYLVDLNATQAAIRAGYSRKTAFRIGAENMQKPAIVSAIQSAMNEREKRTEITQDRVLKEYARIAFFDPARIYGSDGRPIPITKMDEDTRRAVVALDVVMVGNAEAGVGEVLKIRLANKIGALDSLAKHLGMFEKNSPQKNGGVESIADALRRADREREIPQFLKDMVQLK